MATISKVNPSEVSFTVSSKGSGVDPLTLHIQEAIASAEPMGDVIQIECDSVTEARGIGRRVNKALENLSLESDKVRINAFDQSSAIAEFNKTGKVVRLIQRVK